MLISLLVTMGPLMKIGQYGTFTGELFIPTTGEFVLFQNWIDVDGDERADLSVALTLEGLLNSGLETSPGIFPGIPNVDGIWINPTFQWKVTALNQSEALWGSLEHLEVSFMKGLAFDVSLDDSEYYAVVIDTRFTQPPSEFTLGVGIERIEFDISAGNVIDLFSTFIGSLNSSDFSLTSITAPYSVQINNPNAPGTNLQTNCQDENYYDPIADLSLIHI